MAKVIINIHGRSNKPEKSTLVEWWKKATEEGLSYNTTSELGDINFEMAYYAGLHYTDPIPDDDNPEPYKKAESGKIQSYKKSMFDRIRSIGQDWFDDPMDWLEKQTHFFSALGNEIAGKLLKDLGNYYKDNAFRNNVNNTLLTLLDEYKNDEIILISHSMGTIVAYDVLRALGRSADNQDFCVEHFITMGSPLGLSVVKGNVIDFNGKLRTPSCVKNSWVNFSDPQDVVCLDTHLGDDYEANSSNVCVKDVLVCNDYPKNEHKSYGYLRTPEFSEHLASLL